MADRNPSDERHGPGGYPETRPLPSPHSPWDSFASMSVTPQPAHQPITAMAYPGNINIISQEAGARTEIGGSSSNGNDAGLRAREGQVAMGSARQETAGQRQSSNPFPSSQAQLGIGSSQLSIASSSTSGISSMTASPTLRPSASQGSFTPFLQPQGRSVSQRIHRNGNGDYSNSISPMASVRTSSPSIRSPWSPSEYDVPRWQPDHEASFCPICHTQFGYFIRKHHCRKCGRVVCSGCSPHRIVIPHQYIVRPPSEQIHRSLEYEAISYAGFNATGGGERVRLCNPCVPDPNTTPPGLTPHRRSTSGEVPHYIGWFGQQTHPSARNRSATVSSQPSQPRSMSHIPPSPIQYAQPDPRDTYRGFGSHFSQYTNNNGSSSSSRSNNYNSNNYTNPSEASYRSRLQTLLGNTVSGAQGPSAARPSSVPILPNSLEYSNQYGHRNRPLPQAPGPEPMVPGPSSQGTSLAEEDECPVCHYELPSRTLPDFESQREAHIQLCIQAHASGSRPSAAAGTSGTPPARSSRRTAMFPYKATEKDCVDSEECTICFEEYEVGIPMARLECLCRFHQQCIAAWWVKHPGRCPIHQHDSVDY